jgi:SAM-dependent methyltransferase
MLETCTVCGDRLTPYFPKVRDPLTNETFAVNRCVRCGLGHTVPQPADLGRYYVPQYYGNRHGFTAQHCVKRRLGFIGAVLQPGAGRRLLDIGCGDGSFLLAAKEAGWEVMGTELNPQPGRSAGLDVKEAIEQIPGTNQFDCITMWHTLEHMRDVPAMLAQTARLLKPEGKLIVAVPDWGGLQARIFRERWLHLDVPRHLYHFDAGALRHSLTSAGYAIQHEWHQEFEYDLLGWSQSALNYLMPYPNLFSDTLTGKQSKQSPFITAAGFVLGVALTVLLLPALAIGTVAGRGGTLVAVACRSGERVPLSAGSSGG